MISTRLTRRGLAVTASLAFALTAPLLLASCASGTQASTPEQQQSSTLEPLAVEGAWVKSTEDHTGMAMTGAFGTIVNTTDETITIVGASTDAAALVELHEVADGVMRERSGGFVVPAGGSLELVPGGLHIMLMQMPKPILAGEDVTISLELSNGSAFEFTALVKDYAGANEDYGDLQHGNHDHPHDTHDHDEH